MGIDQLIETIQSYDGPRLTFMEVCGTHTMAAARFGIRALLPKTIRLVSGPGCPVCVTPVGYVDHALAFAEKKGVVIATFGDLMRVPGSSPQDGDGVPRSLTTARAKGADVRVVYSALDAIEIARKSPQLEVVFLGVGFETTAPALAATILKAAEQDIKNFSMLSAAKTIPEAMDVLSSAEDLNLNGFLCPGHVSAILGSEMYRPLAEKYGLACAIAGFEPGEILCGLNSLISQTMAGKPMVDNCYASVVRDQGNPIAREMMYRVFKPCDSVWRGIGSIRGSGLCIRAELAGFDAAKKFDVSLPRPREPKGCRCGEVLRGVIDPPKCALFGKACTPDAPQGACMVSSEGSCAASYNYQLGEGQ
ncbi:MAG: hydrogenase formation protein HypD [Myxococcota bacterium]|nr:hydrogenase formation protein HypD [Myxococcota bacterium]